MLLLPAAAMASPTSAALHDAYRWWHRKPACHVRVEFAHGLAKDADRIWSRPTCLIQFNADSWSSYMRAELHRDRYVGRHDILGLGAPDAYSVETWQWFCGQVITDVGIILGHPLSTDPHSPMFEGGSSLLQPSTRSCGTSALS